MLYFINTLYGAKSQLLQEAFAFFFFKVKILQ